ncbi:MAG: T9SS type A sorting domain-containing protein [Bacteroidota bacterium]
MFKSFKLIFIFISLACSTQAQYFDYGFTHDVFPTVIDSGNIQLKYPWAGGMHACQFAQMDLNNDGKNDLVVFDRNGSRIIPFINNGSAGQTQYNWEPKYALYFPPMHDWMELKDYNCDGKPDIFTYGNGGIRIFKNVSDTIPRFKLETDQLLSYYYNGYTNLFVLSADFPAIVDIDGDGDLDILNFWVMGMYVNYHKNFSKEDFGNCDSLDFRLHSTCWGLFSENEASNVLTLNDTTCGSNKTHLEKHSGSTLLAFDADGDGDKDLLVGDVDYSNLILLKNGGNPDSCRMIAQDTLFPSNSVAVNMVSFPVATLVDVNNDQKDDLVVSPFDPSFERSISTHSTWLYMNTGTQQHPVFTYSQNDFLQRDMIDVGVGAYPVLSDWDSDGLLDLFISNYGEIDSVWMENGYLNTRLISSIALYKNTGTAQQPAIRLITKDYANLSSLKSKALYPAFADVNGDGAIDLLLGNSDGSIIYLQNTAGVGNLPVYSNPIFNYQNINVGAYSTPQIIDLNQDGLKDLVSGSQSGTISYYKNTGSNISPVFTHITDSLGKVNVRDYNASYYGYSIPCFFNYNGSLKLFVGSESGNLYSYKNIQNNLTGAFTVGDTMFYVSDSSLHRINEGIRTAPAIADLDLNGFPDLIVGNYAGGLSYYFGTNPPPFWMGISNIQEDIDFNIFPNPSKDLVNIKIHSSNNQTYLLCLKDVMGKIIYQEKIKENTSVNLQQFPSGIYFCSLMDETSFSSTKLMTKKLVIIH